VRLTVVYFGKLMDAAGTDTETVEVPSDITDSDVLTKWLDEFHGMAGALRAPSVRLAINDRFLNAPQALRDGDEVAFMPPVGGG